MSRPDATDGAAARRRKAALEPAGSLMVHDIKNLSFRLGALLHNLESQYEDPQFKKTVLEILNDTVSRMDRIVRAYRNRGDEVVVKIPVDLNEVLRGVVNGVPRSYQTRRDILIHEEYARLPKLWGDTEFLREAFGILVQNALEAMEPGGGRLTLRTGTATARGGGRTIVVRVADTGCGMSREFIRNGLFAPFVTTKENGLGMGLYACRKIIRLHDGRIGVDSRVGQGTTFRVTFNVG